MKITLVLLISSFTLFCYGQEKNELIDNRKQVIMDFLNSEQKVGVKNSFTNYIHFNMKEYNELLKKYGDTLKKNYMIDMIQNNYLKTIKYKINQENYSIIQKPKQDEIRDYNLILPKNKRNYVIYYLVDEQGSIELSFIFEKSDKKIKYFLNDLFPPVFGQKIPVSYLEYFSILKPENE